MDDDGFQEKLLKLVESADQSGTAGVDMLNALLSAACDVAVLRKQPVDHLKYLLDRHYDDAKKAYGQREMH